MNSFSRLNFVLRYFILRANSFGPVVSVRSFLTRKYASAKWRQEEEDRYGELDERAREQFAMECEDCEPRES